MAKIALEDNFEDVLMKAATGLGLGKQTLAEQAGISGESLDRLLEGVFEESALRAVAPVLSLGVEELVDMALKDWHPDCLKLDGLELLNTAFPVPGYLEMTVNSYLVWSVKTGEAIVFDTGTNVDSLIEIAELRKLNLQALFVTHTHRDHVAAYDALLALRPNMTGYVPEREPYKQSIPVHEGAVFNFGQLAIEARSTPGHSPGGTSYVIRGLEQPIAIVGDALFCLSQGGVKQSHYKAAMEANRKQILSLPEETILCPGHGPLTTVQWERARNPFYARK
ncbi:MAG: MBL fold metallo-hydrolase [Coraliomargaritaceae bacterium]